MASAAKLWTLATVVVLALPGHKCQDWASLVNDGLVKYACEGGTATFDWTVPLGPGEEIEAVQWLHEASPANELMAMTHWSKFFPMPAFWLRVNFVPNAGISLSGARQSDAGIYTVVITGHNSTGGGFSLHRKAALQVSDNSLTSTTVEASQQPGAVHNNDTDQWSVDLTCGVFDYLSHPPFDVEWLTPSGVVKQSSHYKDGRFHLLLENPVERGTYTCRIPQSATVCRRGNGRWIREASVTVDDIRSRLAVLEAEQAALVAENRFLKAQNAGVDPQSRASPLVLLALQGLQIQIRKTDADLTMTANNLQASLHTIQQLLNTSEAEKDMKNTAILQQVSDLADNLNAAVNASMTEDSMIQEQLTALGEVLGIAMPGDLPNVADRLTNLETLINTYNSQCSENFNRVTNQLNDRTNALQGQVNDLMSQISNLANTLPAGRLASTDEVSFQAKHHTTTTTTASNTNTTTATTSSIHLSSGETLVLPVVLNNHGHSYDSATGHFTAPTSGTYFLLASTQSAAGGRAGLRLVLNGVPVQEVSMGSSGQSGSVHVVVHLQKGQEAWLESVGDSDYLPEATAFGGFLAGRN